MSANYRFVRWRARLGIFNRFRKDEVVGAKVLVCAWDPAFRDQMTTDANIWKRHYSNTKEAMLSGPDELFRSIDEGYDVVHLLANTDQSGTFANTNLGGTELIGKCCASNVKLLWIASANDAAGYISGFSARGQRINLVMTLKRDDPKFPRFLDRLLEMMSSGLSMPNAWVRLCPQAPGPAHEDVPATIFSAGRGRVILR